MTATGSTSTTNEMIDTGTGGTGTGGTGTGGTDNGGTDTAGTDTAGTSTGDTDATPVCGNGIVEQGEDCDDGDLDETDECTTQCAPPACDDTILSGDETDLDCGGSCSPCPESGACLVSEDCDLLSCIDSICRAPASCTELNDVMPGLANGLYLIDPDGPGADAPYEAMCEMTTSGGGWTLVAVSSNDGTNTWTWNNRTLMTTDTTPVGNVNTLDADFKSPAYHTILMTDLLFVHAPSGVWAQYDSVGDGTTDLGTHLGSLPERVCDYALDDNGVEMSAGTLVAGGSLCDTDLYFHLGDHGNSLGDCQTNGYASSESYGPMWSGVFNSVSGLCPFDDPGETSLGPDQNVSMQDVELNGVGFGAAAGLNTGMAGSGENNMRIYVRLTPA
ncbi:MAG: fibrinogen-like YCDxxxxGGGW domain-containing protein [Myxococcota bacterium]